MPLPFGLACELLEKCHKRCLEKRPTAQVVIGWFSKHRKLLDAPDTDLAALLSTLLPEKRTDRVFCIKTPKLEGIVEKALCLGHRRATELKSHRRPGLGLDLADCVEQLLQATVSKPSGDAGFKSLG